MRPVFARHAASLLLWQMGADGPEVLMGVRGAGHRFMPNRLVFPGGAVDPGDATAAAASEPDAETLAALGRKARPGLSRALVMAAARELEEETGLSLGRPPRLAGIDYLCRAVTPPVSPVRFNARFLVAAATAAEGVPADGDELGNVRFYPLRESMALDLAMVTREVLGRFEAWLAGTRGEAWAFKKRRWERE